MNQWIRRIKFCCAKSAPCEWYVGKKSTNLGEKLRKARSHRKGETPLPNLVTSLLSFIYLFSSLSFPFLFFYGCRTHCNTPPLFFPIFALPLLDPLAIATTPYFPFTFRHPQNNLDPSPFVVVTHNSPSLDCRQPQPSPVVVVALQIPIFWLSWSPNVHP